MWQLRGHSDPISALTFSPDGYWLASADFAGHALRWDLSQPGTKQELPPGKSDPDRRVNDLAFSPDGSKLYACRDLFHTNDPNHDGVGYWSMEDPTTYTALKDTQSQNPALAFTPDKTELVVVSHVYRRWYSQSIIQRLDGETGLKIADQMIGFFWRRDRFTLAISDHFLAVGASETPYIHYTERGTSSGRVRRFQAHPTAVRALAFHPGTDQLASAGPSEIRIWTIPRAKAIRLIPRSGPQYITAMAYSPNGRLLAVGRNGGLINFWSTETWQERATFTWPIGNVRRLAFAPDGLRIAAGGASGSIMVWDVDEE